MQTYTGRFFSSEKTKALVFNDGADDFALIEEAGARWFGQANQMALFTATPLSQVVAQGAFMSADDICDYLEALPIDEIDGLGWTGIEASNDRLSDWVIENTARDEEISEAADVLSSYAGGELIEHDGCYFVYGKIPVKTAMTLMDRLEKGDIQDTALASAAGASLVVGSPENIERIRQTSSFPRPAPIPESDSPGLF